MQPLCQCRVVEVAVVVVDLYSASRSASNVPLVIDRIEGCGHGEADKQRDFFVVSRSVDAVKDIEQRRLGRMPLPVGRLPS